MSREKEQDKIYLIPKFFCFETKATCFETYKQLSRDYMNMYQDLRLLNAKT